MNKHALQAAFSLLNIDCVILDRRWNFNNTTSVFYRLYLITAGEGIIYNPETRYVLEPGYLYLVPSFTVYSCTCTGHLQQYYLHFIEESGEGLSIFAYNRRIMRIKASSTDYDLCKRLVQLNPHRGLYQTHNPDIYEKRPVLQSFHVINNGMPFGAYAETAGIILQLVSRFLNPECFKLRHAPSIPSKIHDAINFIQTHLTSGLTVQALANRANYNADYFSKVFLESTGERPLKFIQLKRIERAQMLLATTEISFSEVALQTGFDNAAYFSRVFRALTGTTPSDYRRINKQF